MFKSVNPLIFIKADRNKGFSEKTKKDYDFATIKISDGLESLTLNCEPELASMALASFKKGDKVSLLVDVSEVNNRANFIVTQINKA